MKLLLNIVRGVSRGIYFIPALIIIILLVFLLGHPILGPGLPGGDNPNFITLASWLSQWWPRIPFWYPQQGGGMSFTISYPFLNHYLIVLIEKLYHIPIAVAFRIWALVTIVLTAIGLYLLSFRLTRNQTLSALTPVFYLISPITWAFLLGWGFAAEQLTYIFIPPLFIFISLFLEEYYLKGLTRQARFYFLLSSIFLTLISIAHSMVYVGVFMFVVCLFIAYPLTNFRKKETKRINVKHIISTTSIAFFIFLLSSLFWTLPFFRYQRIVAQGAPFETEVENRHVFLQNAVYPLNLFGITDKTVFYKSLDDPIQYFSPSSFRNVNFPLAISLLALVGLVGSFFINRKIFAFGLANLLPLVITVSPQITNYFFELPYANYYLNWRSVVVPSRFVIPLLAAFGCFCLAYLFTFPLDLLSKKIKEAVTKSLFRLGFIFLSAVFTLATALTTLWLFRNWPNNPKNLLAYGREVGSLSKPLNTEDIWGIEVDYCQGPGKDEDRPRCTNPLLVKYFWEGRLKETCKRILLKPNRPQEIVDFCGSNPSSQVIMEFVDICKKDDLPFLSWRICETKIKSIIEQLKPEMWLNTYYGKNLFTEGSQIYGNDRKIFDALPKTSNSRIDIGTLLGSFLMIEPFYSNMPELPVYYNQGSLIKTLWNYQIAVFNQKETVWPQDSIMSELSKYFGLEYALMAEKLAPLDKYARTGWEMVDKVGIDSWGGGGVGLWKFKDAAGLLRVTTKPTILVIGQDKVGAYFRFFHLANLGVLPFEDGIIVKGGSYVDEYTAEELQKFDAVVLSGYSYKNENRKKGQRMLDTYVKNGGSLLINTGWQYSSVGWQVSKTPPYQPLEELKWINPDREYAYLFEEPRFAENVDVSKFPPLFDNNKPWGISTTDRSKLRGWAKIILSANDKPLVAGGAYGSGRVIWTGLDLPGHIGAYSDNEEEIKLYKNLLNYLLENKKGRILAASFKRDYPDKLEITINESSDEKVAVYFSEAYYPDFKAKLVTSDKSQVTRLKTYKAGPGMTIFILSKVTAGAKIIYEYQTPISIILARVISLITLLLIIATILIPEILKKIQKAIIDRLKQGRIFRTIIRELNAEVYY